MRMIRAIIVDDEPLARVRVRDLLSAAPDVEIVAECANGEEAIRAVEESAPDLLFLDIQMPGLTGLEVARRLERGARIVFVTAYDAHAVAAFEREAVDYILKPWTAQRLAESLRRIQERMRQPRPAIETVLEEIAAAVQPRNYLRWINASAGQEVRIITVEEICYFKADSKYTVVVTAAGETLVRRALKDMAAQLDPTQFWQIHRSTIVNAGAIAAVTRDLGGHVRLKLKSRPETLAVSEAHEHLFRSM